MTFTQPISIYGIPVDEAVLSLAEKSAIVVERGDARRVPVDDLVATEGDVVVDAVNRYRAERTWHGSRIDVLERAGHYLILDGHHRAAAAADAGIEEIRAEVR